MDDEKIVQLFLNRDENAIKYSAEKYSSRLRALCCGITADMQTAEECENDTYLKAWNLIPPNEPKTYLYAFLARIARHISIDRCRERASLKRDAIITELNAEIEMCLPTADDIDTAVAEKELAKAISSFLNSVSQEKRVIFVRRYFYLDSISEISKRCAVTESKVKSSLYRTRNELREYLIKEGYTL